MGRAGMKPRQLVLIVLASAGLLALRSTTREMVLPQGSSLREVELSQAVALVKDGRVARAVVTGDVIELEDGLGGRLATRKEPGVSFLQTLLAYGATPEQVAPLQMEVKPTTGPLEAASVFALAVAMLVALGLLLVRPRPRWAFGGANPADFRRSTAREHKGFGTGLTFEEVAGAEEAKQELAEVVEFLKNPARFASMGARVPRGLLLVGPPGSGKTLLARAVAGEAGVPFFSCNGSEFMEMFVGVGAARIRDLFQRAKKSAPCIVFIDEIDAIGRKRNSTAASEEREHSLNQILVEMDGFDQNANIVVIAATNRPDVLDPALLRPGRFDRRILVDSPDLKDRLAILRLHSRGKPLSPEIDLQSVARQTTGFSGADLENLLNEAALLATRRGSDCITAGDVEEAMDRVLMGLARKSRVIGEREKWIAAYHEAGHALVARALPQVDPVQRVSIIPRGSFGGHTRLLPMEDRHLWSRSQLSEAICFALAGMVAEELVFGETTTGSAGDLAEATNIARKMVCLFGMSAELGPFSFGSEQESCWLQQPSQATTTAADMETRRLLEEGQRKARELLEANRARLALLATRLFEQETLQRDELESVLQCEPGSADARHALPAYAACLS